jgi:hypothetical protein
MDSLSFRDRCVRALGELWEADLDALGPIDAGLWAVSRIGDRKTVSYLLPETLNKVTERPAPRLTSLSLRRLARLTTSDPFTDPERQITDFFVSGVKARCPVSGEAPCRKRWLGDVPPGPGPDSCEFCGRALEQAMATMTLAQAVKFFRELYSPSLDQVAVEHSIACAVSRALGRPETLPEIHWKRWG